MAEVSWFVIRRTFESCVAEQVNVTLQCVTKSGCNLAGHCIASGPPSNFQGFVPLHAISSAVTC